MVKTMAVGKVKVAEWAIELRPLDAHVVSQYRQHMRAGATFPALVVDAKTKEVISGNHRTAAALQEFGPDYKVTVDMRNFKCRADQLALMVAENVTHGHRMDTITKKRFTVAMRAEGMSIDEVREVFGVSVQSVERWAGETVFVIGKGSQPVKLGFDRDYVEKVDQRQYDEHIARDRGQTIVSMASQIVRWIENGWVDPTDPGVREALRGLKAALCKIGV